MVQRTLDWQMTHGSQDYGIQAQAHDIQEEEYRRYGAGLAPQQAAYGRLSSVLQEPLDGDLLFSKSADSIGSRVSNQRNSLGARGLSPNSGAASGLLSRMAFGQQQALAGARLESEIEAKKMRQTNAATDFAAAGQLGDYINSPVPQVALDASLAISEKNAAERGQQAALDAQRRANRANILGSLLQGGMGILGRMVA